VVNPSGGLISKGHPLGATGGAVRRADLAACAGAPVPVKSTVPRSRCRHNIGLGGACVVSVYKQAR